MINQKTQTINSEDLQQEIDDMQNRMTLMYARFGQIDNLPGLVKALLESENFKKIGEAIQPMIPKLPVTPQEPVKPKPKFTLSGWLKTKHIAFLDLFATIAVTTMFIGFSYAVLTSFAGWGVIVGLSVLWIVYVVVARLVAGGLLN